MKKIILVATAFCTLAIAQQSKAQNIFPANGNVGIGTPTPNGSAILEVNSSTKGMLTPRMTKAQRDAIVNPATGLLIYQTNLTPGFYYYTSTAWKPVSTANSVRGLGNNLFIGTNAGTSNLTGKGNIALGNSALNANAKSNNIAIGDSALKNYRGDQNLAVGTNALFSDTSGQYNTALGNYSLMYNSSGENNTSVGLAALKYNTTGNNNSTLGALTLINNTTGYLNTAMGTYSMYKNIDGGGNTATGYNSLADNTSGSQNTAYGSNAGSMNSTGSNNSSFGTLAYFSNQNLNNNTAIGYESGGIVNASNRVEIGNTSITYIGGQVSFASYSDGRIKENVKQNVPGLDFINKLRPVTYNFNIHKENEMVYKGKKNESDWKEKYDIEKMTMTGFIAQEVEAAAKEVDYDFSGVVKPENPDELYSLRYSEFVVPVVKAVQELDTKSIEQNKKIETLEQENAELKKEIAEIKSVIMANNSNQELKISSDKNVASLSKIVPNPFSDETEIQLSIPATSNKVELKITDNNGKVILTNEVTSRGNCSIKINTATLASGIYFCTLIADGQTLATEKMNCVK